MKTIKTKAEIRKELAQEVEDFLNSGGTVHDIPSGVSGHEDNKNIFAQQNYFRPRQSRTPLNEIVLALDSRKARKKIKLKPKRGPRKKLLTDDFGEPVRWIWEDIK